MPGRYTRRPMSTAPLTGSVSLCLAPSQPYASDTVLSRGLPNSVVSNVEVGAVAVGSRLAVATVSPWRLARRRVVPVVLSWIAARLPSGPGMLRVHAAGLVEVPSTHAGAS